MSDKMQHPKEIIRTTLGEYLARNDVDDTPGVYVVACYPQLGCVYIGKTENSVIHRIREHLGSTDSHDRLGSFVRQVFADACGFRLDILVPPDGCDAAQWLGDAETRLIHRFGPMLNTVYNAV